MSIAGVVGPGNPVIMIIKKLDQGGCLGRDFLAREGFTRIIFNSFVGHFVMNHLGNQSHTTLQARNSLRTILTVSPSVCSTL